MIFNVTMLLQAVHFLLAYWCIRFVFFRKALTVIEFEEHERDHALDQLSHLQEKVHAAESLVNTEWHLLQRGLVEQKPEDLVVHQSHVSIMQSTPVVQYDKINIDHLAKDIEASLIKKVTQAGDL